MQSLFDDFTPRPEKRRRQPVGENVPTTQGVLFLGRNDCRGQQDLFDPNECTGNSRPKIGAER